MNASTPRLGRAPRRFLDTNILLYALSTDQGERAKKEIAVGLLEFRDLGLSMQVLQEFYVQATRPTRPDRLRHDQAVTLIKSFRRFPVQFTDLLVLEAALDTSHRFHISFWDAAIIEAARTLGCSVVLSEDLNHGQDFAGVQIINPFLPE